MHFLTFLDRGWQVGHFTGIVWDIGDSLGSRWSKRDFTSTISYLRHSIYVAATNTVGAGQRCIPLRNFDDSYLLMREKCLCRMQ